MSSTPQQRADFATIQKGLEADEVRGGQAKKIRDRIDAFNDKQTLGIYATRLMISGISEKMQLRVQKWIKERMAEL